MAYQLPILTDQDFEVTYAEFFCSSSPSSSLGSSGASSPSSSSTSCSTTSSISAHSKKHVLAATTPEYTFLHKKRTMPLSFCPKQRTPKSRYHPAKVTESQAPRIPYVPRPLQHIYKRKLSDPDNNENMKKYREFRQIEMQKAQVAKVSGSLEEPPKKKKAQRRRKEY